jgi:trimethylamine--corrinoid protein Co-methyltransferase
MLASLMACSLEAMVVDNDMLGAINRTVRGIEITPDTLSTKAIADVVHGAGHFLGHPQTLAMMQSEYTYPIVGDRLSPDDWVDAGAKNVKRTAHEYVVRTLVDHVPGHVPLEVDRKIRRQFGIQVPSIRD